MSRHFWYSVALCLTVFTGFYFWQTAHAAVPVGEAEPTLPARTVVIPKTARKAVFAGGCFWGVQEKFRTIPGVLDTKAGYTGGHTAYPTYESLHVRETGHVEAVEITFDPAVVPFTRLVEAFFADHDSTLPDRNGQRMGKQYRSFVFYQDAGQKTAVEAVIQRLTRSRKYPGAPRPIVTRVRPAETFWPAEEHHQFYYQKRGLAAACAL